MPFLAQLFSSHLNVVNMLQEKIIALQNYCATQNIDALLLVGLGHECNDALVTYLLGYAPENAAIIITENKAILWLTPFEVPEAEKNFPELTVLPLGTSLSSLIKSVLPSGKIGVRNQVFPVALYKALENTFTVVEATGLEMIVACKNTAEIAAMRAVCAKTDDLFKELIAHWSEFVTEMDAAQFIHLFAIKNNCTVSFPPIIASGAHAAEPHHHTLNEKIEPGFCVLDLGLQINGYCSDLSRTIFIGSPTDAQKARYELVKNAQQMATELVKPGVLAKDLDAACHTALGEMEKNFIHGLGHGVGTAVHEWPSIAGKSAATLEENMIITIEPGIYLPNEFGIRIEDDVLVTKTGFEVLNQTTKELIVIV